MDDSTTSDDVAGHDPAPLPGPAGFDALGLRAELVGSVTALGYEEPTPIQQESIPVLVTGRDVLGQAATGTGKTAAFALPLLERFCAGGRSGSPFAVVLVPTRELAMQVSEAVYRYGRDLGVRVTPIVGGQPIGRQIRSLERGAHVVVATPGRAVDHLTRGTLDLDSVEVVVLDEADEMLDMGFAEDLEAILERTPTDRQTVLFSATMPANIDRLARKHLREPERIRIAGPAADGDGPPLVRQQAHLVARPHKLAALARVLDVEAPTAAIVFCRTRLEVDEVTETLNGRGYRAEALHGGMSQEQRDRVMSRLRAGTADLLVATDVAARGLDLDQLTHVINYDVPSAPEAYVHRIGRVGRAGRTGVAITLAEPREQRMLANIERLIGQPIPMERVPSVADLRARQLDQIRDALQTALDDGDLDEAQEVVEALGDEFDPVDLAVAAIHLLREATGASDDEAEIPEVKRRSERKHERRPGRDDRRREAGGRDGPRGNTKTTTLFVSVGRIDGIRPKDLVGAFANEAGLAGRDIGPITIAERHSTVGVPAAAADRVIEAMRRTTIKGRRAEVRPDRYSR